MTKVPEQIRVLHVDDQTESAAGTAEFLEREVEGVRVETVATISEAIDRMEAESYDCVISEYELDQGDGLEFLSTVRSRDAHLPFIIYTATGSEQVAAEAISAGVTDYIQKGNGSEQVGILARRVRNAVAEYHSTAQTEATKQRLRELTDATQDVLWMFDADWDETLFINSAYEPVWGRSRASLQDDPGDLLRGVHPDDRELLRDVMDSLSAGETVDIDIRVNADENYERWVWFGGEPLRDESGQVTRIAGFARDITHRREREHDLRQSQMLVETLTTALPDYIFIYDSTGTYLDMITGSAGGPVMYEPAELIGERVEDILGAQTAATIKTAIDTALEEEAIQTIEYTIETGAGPYWYEAHVAPIPDGYDGREAVLLAARNITRRKQREHDLTQLQDRTRRLMETETVRETAQVAVDTAHDVLGAQLSGFHLITNDGDAFEPVAFVDVVREKLEKPPVYRRPPAGGPTSDIVWEAFESGETISIDDTHDHENLADATPTRSGIIYPLGDHGVFIVSSTEPNAFDENDKNLSEILANSLTAALDRVEREQDLRKRNEYLNEFASIVSHDLRSPLNVAKGRLELARDDPDAQHLEDVETAIDRSLSLIDDLLLLARDGGDVDTLSRMKLESVVDSCWGTVETSNATLVSDVSHSIRADRGGLKRLLENLFRNAVEHGGPEVVVTVGDLEDGFYVADDGSGIPVTERGEVFDSGYSTSAEGTGFGLAIVREIGTAHGWDVTVAESESGGTRIEITGVELA